MFSHEPLLLQDLCLDLLELQLHIVVRFVSLDIVTRRLAAGSGFSDIRDGESCDCFRGLMKLFLFFIAYNLTGFDARIEEDEGRCAQVTLLFRFDQLLVSCGLVALMFE